MPLLLPVPVGVGERVGEALEVQDTLPLLEALAPAESEGVGEAVRVPVAVPVGAALGVPCSCREGERLALGQEEAEAEGRGVAASEARAEALAAALTGALAELHAEAGTLAEAQLEALAEPLGAGAPLLPALPEAAPLGLPAPWLPLAEGQLEGEGRPLLLPLLLLLAKGAGERAGLPLPLLLLLPRALALGLLVGAGLVLGGRHVSVLILLLYLSAKYTTWVAGSMAMPMGPFSRAAVPRASSHPAAPCLLPARVTTAPPGSTLRILFPADNSLTYSMPSPLSTCTPVGL